MDPFSNGLLAKLEEKSMKQKKIQDAGNLLGQLGNFTAGFLGSGLNFATCNHNSHPLIKKNSQKNFKGRYQGNKRNNLRRFKGK